MKLLGNSGRIPGPGHVDRSIFTVSFLSIFECLFFHDQRSYD
ncbi:hypothetical protein C7S14_7645 [Burkholderia cepacia]|nr:hypothetical protein C7S14_7645 [Burkholderia cepacia]